MKKLLLFVVFPVCSSLGVVCWLHFSETTKTLDDFPITQLGIYVMSTKKEKKGKVDIDVQGFPLVTGFVTGWQGFQFPKGRVVL